MPKKYDPLEEYLRDLGADQETVTLSMAEIAEIVGFGLPRSAYTYRAWWSNQSDVSNRPQARAWINAGYRVDAVQQQDNHGVVRFVRRSSAQSR